MGENVATVENSIVVEQAIQPGVGDPVSSQSNQITISVEELESKIQSAVRSAEHEASSVEKSKLYDTIEKFKADKRDLERQLHDLRSSAKLLDEKKDKERREKMSAEELRDEQIQKANLELEQMKDAFQRLKQETAQTLREKELQLYRERLITQASGNIIPELVTGNSEDELEASFKKAVDRFNFIKGQVSQELQNKLKQESRTVISKETPNQTKQTLPPETKEATAEEIRNMTSDQYKKYKEELLAKYGI